MKKFIISLFTFATFAFSAINLAVIETEAESSAAAELTEAELRYITQEIRRAARSNLPDDYNVMTEQAVMALGDAVLEEFAEETRMISFGEKIGADYITKGSVSKFRTMYVLTIEIFETKKGMMVASSDPIESTDLNQFIPEIRKVAPALFAKFTEATKKKQTVEEKNVKQQERGQKHKEDLEKIAIGIRAGFNLYNYFDDADVYKMGMGYGGGLAVRIPLVRKLLLNPGLDFYYRELLTWDGGDGSMSEFVISIPILLQFMPIEHGSFFLAAGPRLDIPIKSELKYNDKTYDFSRSAVDVSAVLGLGYMVLPGLKIDARTSMSMIPIFDDGGDKYGYYMQLGLGVTYFF